MWRNMRTGSLHIFEQNDLDDVQLLQRTYALCHIVDTNWTSGWLLNQFTLNPSYMVAIIDS